MKNMKESVYKRNKSNNIIKKKIIISYDGERRKIVSIETNK